MADNKKKAPQKKKVDENAQVKKAVKKAAKKATKKALKNRGVQIALIVLVVLIITAIVVVYLVKPEIFDSILHPDSSNTAKGGQGNNQNVAISDGDLYFHTVDIGQGDCLLICFPDGKDMLIDCGSDKGGSYEKANTYISQYVTDNQLDYVMLTHTDNDHVSYLKDVLNDYQCDHIIMPNIKSGSTKSPYAEQIAALDSTKLAKFTDPDMVTTDTYAKFFIAALSEPNCEIVLTIGNFSISGENWKMDIFCWSQQQWDDNKVNTAYLLNGLSPICILQYNGKKIVFTGDSNEKAYSEPSAVAKMKAYYGVDILDCDVLKVAHHGSDTSSCDEFLDFVKCEYAIISCGLGPKHGHPRYEALDRIIERDMALYRTDLHGNVVVHISGNTLTITPQNANIDNTELWTGYTDGDGTATKLAVKGD